MKIVKQFFPFIVLVILLFSLNYFKDSPFLSDSAIIKAAESNFCPGSGSSCYFWGIMTKGPVVSYIDIKDDDI